MNKNGFTLLEVVLFLAISSALAVIAFAGLTPRLNNVRFTQSVRGSEAIIAKQFTASTLGENSRSDLYSCQQGTNSFGKYYPQIVPDPSIADPRSDSVAGVARGASSTCVVNGKIVLFEADKMVFFSLVSFRKSPYPADGCEGQINDFASLVDCYKTRIARGKILWFDEPPDRVEIKYQNGATASSDIGNGNQLVFGYVQNPENTDKYQFFYIFGSPLNVNTNPDVNSENQPVESANTRETVSKPWVCLNLGTRKAKMSFSTNNLLPKVEYDVECT